MIMEIISYIRSLWPTSKPKRKRSAIDDFDFAVSPKIRKLSLSQMSTPEDEWLSNSSSRSTNKMRRSFLDPVDIIHRPSWSKPIIIDDDDDDVTDNKANRIHSTSTPNYSRLKENGFDDISCTKYREPIKRPMSKIEKFETPMLFPTIKSRNYKTPLLGSKDVTPKFTSGIKMPVLSSLDFSFRLDEKQKYEELISKNRNSAVVDYDSFYRTPIGKITPLSRTRRILQTAFKPVKPIATYDLTNGDNEKKLKLSTKDTIIKVLNKADNDVVVIKDTDSDVEILPNPPSPKPDIKVDRINTLKKSVQLPRSPDWIEQKVKKHLEEISKRENEIRLSNEKLKVIREINTEVKTKQLEEQVKRCLQIKDIIVPIEVKQALPELTDEQEAMVDMAFDKRKNQSEILASKFSLNITRRDMLTLSGLNWLNDEVINFYMNLIIERGKHGKYPKAYAFNTFFYPKVLKDGHSSIRRWTRKIDIFSYDLICVPIHMSMHWCMAIIDFRPKTVTYYDSMGKSNFQCTDTLLRYLQEEHLDKKKCPYDTSDWKMLCPKDIPQQMNGSDCGMFSCTFAEFVSRNAPITFSQENMPYLRRKMVVEIMLGQLLLN